MSIIGLDEVTLTTEDLGMARTFLQDFGLREVEHSDAELVFHAKDGTGLRVRRCDDDGLPPGVVDGPNIREALWGVSDEAALARIGAELRRDRPAQVGADGVLRSTDNDGYAVGFRVSRRKLVVAEPSRVNVPGQAPLRAVNTVPDFAAPIVPSSFSHLVLYTPDIAKAETFYQRIGFRITDRFTGTGVFLRADGHPDHHQLFLTYKPSVALKGLNHVAFHVRDHLELMLAGQAFARKGGATTWGPGRHIFGSNHFWYFKSPFGGNIEYDADMDVVDDEWQPREVKAGPTTGAIWVTPYHGPASH